MKQADTLKHGLDLASQVGNIGKFGSFWTKGYLFGHILNLSFPFFLVKQIYSFFLDHNWQINLTSLSGGMGPAGA